MKTSYRHSEIQTDDHGEYKYSSPDYKKPSNNGFREGKEVLKTDILWMSYVQVCGISQRRSERAEWIMVKEWNGACFSCFVPELWDKIKLGGSYYLSGKISVGKGGTYLNIEGVNEVSPDDFVEAKKVCLYILSPKRDIEEEMEKGEEGDEFTAKLSEVAKD